MSKDFAWELFKSTGNVDAFMIMRNIESGTEKNNLDGKDSNVLGDINGDNKN